VPYDNKIEFQIAPPPDAQTSAGACHEKFGVRELALAFTAQRPPHPRISTLHLYAPYHSTLNTDFPCLHRSRIANDNDNDNPTRIVILSDQRESKGLPSRALALKSSASRRLIMLSDQRESKGLSPRSLPLKPLSARLLIANPELESLASHTKRGLLMFSNRKKIAVFHPAPSPPIDEQKKLSSPPAHRDNRRRRRTALRQHISNRNIRFTEFRSTRCKQTLYQFSNRNKNAHFAFSDSTSATYGSHAANRTPLTTTRDAFRSTIPARPHAYR
jgi:hypothetical protein